MVFHGQTFGIVKSSSKIELYKIDIFNVDIFNADIFNADIFNADVVIVTMLIHNHK